LLSKSDHNFKRTLWIWRIGKKFTFWEFNLVGSDINRSFELRVYITV
jgi:hypothetical protein